MNEMDEMDEMNEYEEALDTIANIVLDEEADGYMQPKTVQDFCYESIEKLRKLVEERTVPKRIELCRIKKYDGYNIGTCTCGEVIDDSMIEGLRYCPWCGRAIDLSDENEEI